MIDIIALVIGFTQTFKVFGVKGKFLLMPIAIILGALFNMMSTEWSWQHGLEGAAFGLAATMIVHLAKQDKEAIKEKLRLLQTIQEAHQDLKEGKTTIHYSVESVMDALEKPENKDA